ncbi:MAG: twin-arginine translocase TatA/TatE family subunit [Blastochloris viridis]|uniref:Sec-independent protein translocase protein TatA n=1 Tax=Blastochloris viridis TaxID=1079 RepID=A0A6N4R3Y6_BLAVI|nr:MAG: twin-arginine translocase TatA/TatE family subunit [Blastochloris viridis]
MIEKILILLVVAVVMLVVFGNRLPQVMGDLGKGVRAFKQGVNDATDGDDDAPKRKKKAKPAVKTAKAKAVKSKTKPRG